METNKPLEEIHRLVESVRPYAYKLAHKATRVRHPVYDFDDAYQAAMYGALVAAYKYDSTVGCSYFWYAVYWMLNRVQALNRTSCVVRIPQNTYTKLSKEEKMEAVWRRVVLEELDPDSDSPGAAKFLCSPEDLQAAAVECERKAILMGLVCKLPDRKRRIIARYFGLEGLVEETISSLAESEGVSRQRVYQIVEESLVTLRKWASHAGLA